FNANPKRERGPASLTLRVGIVATAKYQRNGFNPQVAGRCPPIPDGRNFAVCSDCLGGAMAATIAFRQRPLLGSLFPWLPVLALCVVALPPIRAQELPRPTPTIDGFPPTLTPAPQNAPRPASGPRSVAEFLEGLTTNDASFEVKVGQGRIVTVKENLAVPGKPSALIAVGDPSVLDFAILSPPHIRA